MKAPACLLVTLTIVASAPQPTPTPPPSSSQPSLSQHTLASLFTNCVELDILEIEGLRSKLHNTIDFDLTGKKDNISFGLLEEDWIRLKLLEERLPVNSLLKPKLLKLFRLVITALFQAHKSTVKIAKIDNKSFENNKLNQTELNPPNFSKPLLKPTTVNKTNVLSITTVTATTIDEMDNVAAESEQQESVLPFNTFASPYEIETTKTLPFENTDFTSNLNKEDNNETIFLQLPDQREPNNHSVKVDDINSERTTNEIQNQNSTLKYDSITTEVYKNLTINYEKEHDALSVETKGDTNNNIEEPKEVKLVEEYDFSSTVVDDWTGISKEAATLAAITSSASTSDGSYYHSSLNPRYASDSPSSPSTFVTFTPETNENDIEYTEKDHGTPYHGTESGSIVSEDIYGTDSSSPTTMYAEQSSETSLSRESTLILPSPSQDDISKRMYNSTDSYSSTGQYTARDVDNLDQSKSKISSIEHPNYYLSSTNPNSAGYNDITNETYTDGPSPSDLISTTSEENSRHDKSLHSTKLSPFSSTQSMKTALSKTVNETFHSFTVMFPEYPELTSPRTKMNKLIIYPLNGSQNVIFPFGIPRRPPTVQADCHNKNACVRVQNIEFNNPPNYDRYTVPNSETSSEDIRLHNIAAETNLKNWDSDTILWWNKIRTLRKKAVER